MKKLPREEIRRRDLALRAETIVVLASCKLDGVHGAAWTAAISCRFRCPTPD